MDECHCYANPQVSGTDLESESPLLHNDQQHYNVEFEYSKIYVFGEEAYGKVSVHNFPNIPKDEITHEATIMSWLSDMDVPQKYESVVLAEVLRCARDMVRYKDSRVLCMRVKMSIIENEDEDEINYSDNDNDYSFEEFDGADVFEEDDDEEDYGFMPADKESVESLEIVEQKDSENCGICFEDFHVGVRMPCLHMFHKSCITEWLKISNSCPLCRFHLLTGSD